MKSLKPLLSIFAFISLGLSHTSSSSTCTGLCIFTHAISNHSTSSQSPSTASSNATVMSYGKQSSAITANSTAVSYISLSSSRKFFNSSSSQNSIPFRRIFPFPTGPIRSLAANTANSPIKGSTTTTVSHTQIETASTGSVAATASSTTIPVFATLLTTSSGSTLTQIVIGHSTSGITLIPAQSGILHSTDPAASSTAILVSGKLKKVNEKVKEFETKAKSDPSTGPPVGLLKDTISLAEGFLKHLTPPSSNSGGCTASLFGLVSCAVSDLQTLVGKVKGGIDDIGPLLDHLSKLSGELGKVGENKPKTGTPTKSPVTSPTTEATSSKSSDDSSTTSKSTSSSTSSSSSATSSSSSCGSVSDVNHVTSICFNTTISTSTFRTCTPHTQTVSGCDVTAFTTTTTSSGSSIAAAPAMTWFSHPEEPTGTAGYAELAQYILSTLRAMNRLPKIPTTLGTQTTTKTPTSKGSKSSRSSGQLDASISPAPSHSSAVALSTTPTTNVLTTNGETKLPTESSALSKLPSITHAPPSCGLASTTWGPITESGTTYTAGVGDVLTTCTCDNGLSGDTMLLPNPTSASSSILYCQIDSTSYPISTIGPSPTPSAAVEILIQYAKWMAVDQPLNWYVFQFPDSNTTTNDPPPLSEACNWNQHALLHWGNDTSSWNGETVSDYEKSILQTRDFSFPTTEVEEGSFDLGGQHGCYYRANPAGLWKPGFLSCQWPSGELECQANNRPKAICDSGYYMVPRAWCPLPV